MLYNRTIVTVSTESSNSAQYQQLYTSAANNRRRKHYVFRWSVRLSVCPSVRCLTVRLTYISHTTISTYRGISIKLGTHIHHDEWALLKRFPRSEVKGQGHSDVKCTDTGILIDLRPSVRCPCGGGIYRYWRCNVVDKIFILVCVTYNFVFSINDAWSEIS